MYYQKKMAKQHRVNTVKDHERKYTKGYNLEQLTASDFQNIIKYIASQDG